jgi:CubicO group peptidase (beta-lactamase class C family)
MSVPVALEDLPAVIEARGRTAFLTSSGASRFPHVKHVEVRVIDGELVCASGGRIEANIAVSPTVVLLWPVAGDRGHSLLVDGRARVAEAGIIVTPERAMLHRPPWLPGGDPPPLRTGGTVPARGWDVVQPDADVENPALLGLAELLMASDEPGPTGLTRALVVVHRGRIVAERYGPDTDLDAALLSWSMAKSVLHAAVGVLVGDGALDADAPAPVAAWHGADDPRAAITVRDLLQMRDGLSWNEDYVDGDSSDVVEMLFGRGHADMAAYATGRPVAHEPGAVFNYSSGTSMVLADVLATVLVGADADAASREQAVRRLLADRVFDPIGVTSAEPDFDPAGTWVASSAVRATARDWARFGLLYLRGGSWDGRQVVPADWVESARRSQAHDVVADEGFGEHWWMIPDRHGTFAAQGYEGQRLLLVPTLDLVVVRLGATPAERMDALDDVLAAIIGSFAGDP